jgi:hypothetical protein
LLAKWLFMFESFAFKVSNLISGSRCNALGALHRPL